MRFQHSEMEVREVKELRSEASLPRLDIPAGDPIGAARAFYDPERARIYLSKWNARKVRL